MRREPAHLGLAEAHHHRQRIPTQLPLAAAALHPPEMQDEAFEWIARWI